ncbi:50S ribosomal protein L2 [Candidatus Wolfebacteria bacterium]|nr:50S ribosomal protein L2 [Candidatus Wolfebacteria bacterium]
MKHHNPRTPGRRQLRTVDYSALNRVAPFKRLLRKLPTHSGRNSQGRITMRHQGGGVGRLYRVVDFKQNKVGVPSRVMTVEYDPYRTAFIARVLDRDGQYRYILASKNLKVGDSIITEENAPPTEGNRSILRNIPVGYLIHNVELERGRGGQLARSAGSYAEVLAHENGLTHVKLSSGEIRKILWNNFASIGQVSNPDHNLVVLGKAGRARHMGVRPTVRGSAMNPRDHPYGGGEGRALRGTKRPKTKWGKVTGGRKTRPKKKWSNVMIIKRRG